MHVKQLIHPFLHQVVTEKSTGSGANRTTGLSVANKHVINFPATENNKTITGIRSSEYSITGHKSWANRNPGRMGRGYNVIRLSARHATARTHVTGSTAADLLHLVLTFPLSIAGTASWNYGISWKQRERGKVLIKAWHYLNILLSEYHKSHWLRLSPYLSPSCTTVR